MERPDLYQDDLTEERQPSPAARDVVAGTQTLDPDISGGTGQPAPRATTDGDAEDDDDDVDEDDEEDEDDDDLDD
ncbi:MAG TPA: hypothetical protein VFB22_09410 [Candidatus Baltobacteraceae bacterium]|nr:hypothetical protein [Candidatus Baltobacteraceae bacterium]